MTLARSTDVSCSPTPALQMPGLHHQFFFWAKLDKNGAHMFSIWMSPGPSTQQHVKPSLNKAVIVRRGERKKSLLRRGDCVLDKRQSSCSAAAAAAAAAKLECVSLSNTGVHTSSTNVRARRKQASRALLCGATPAGYVCHLGSLESRLYCLMSI